MHTRSPKQSTAKRNNGLASEEWIDITVPLSDGMVNWPGDPPIKVFRIRDMGKGDEFNMTALSMSVHSATHLDAPSHFTKLKTGIDKMPLSAVVGNARVIEIEDRDLIKPEELGRYKIKKGERILFKTRNSKRRWDKRPFNENFVHLSTDAAKYLVERQVQTIGVDYLSIGGYEGNVSEVHHIILNARIWVIEGLDLSHVEPGNYELICLPIKIENCEGAPARALLRPV